MEVEFKDYIFSFVDVEKKKIEPKVLKSPEELLDEAGYIFFECHTEEEIQRRNRPSPGERVQLFHRDDGSKNRKDRHQYGRWRCDPELQGPR